MPNISAYGLNYDPEYNTPPNVGKSSIDYQNAASTLTSEQLRTFKWIKSALIEAAKLKFFTSMADVMTMPKHFGKKIKRYHYLPLLDDRNVNDQGIDATGAVIANGNLYGSSHDVGTILAKLPTLGENGARVNRVGFSRFTIEGTFQKFGFFYEFSQESIDFDSDEGLMQHLARETIVGAQKIYENVLNIDLLQAAGIIHYAGSATSLATMTATASEACVLSYDTLRRIDQELTANNCNRSIKMVTGSRNTDTRTISSARVAYVGPEMRPLLEDMVDKFNRPAFVPVHQYGAATSLVNEHEIGSVGCFRFIEVEDAVYYAANGAVVPATGDQGYRTAADSTGTEHFSVYPVLFIGEGSFTTIGFNGTGGAKFKILTKMPGRETASREHDPFGFNGYSSIYWYYGFIAWRSEKIAVAYSLAPQ